MSEQARYQVRRKGTYFGGERGRIGGGKENTEELAKEQKKRAGLLSGPAMEKVITALGFKNWCDQYIKRIS